MSYQGYTEPVYDFNLPPAAKGQIMLFFNDAAHPLAMIVLTHLELKSGMAAALGPGRLSKYIFMGGIGMNALLLILSASLSLGFLSGCSKDKDKSTKPAPTIWFWQQDHQQDNQQEQQNALRVVDLEGRPVAGAQILIGQELPNAIISELIVTDQDGRWTAPEGWVNPEVITISAPGFIRASYLNQRPQGQSLKLTRFEADQKIELKGKTTGYSIKERDGIMDFSLVFPAFTKTDLFGFDLSMVISSELDTISAGGQRMTVPSNLSIPRQTESYIIPVTLQKDAYRIYFKSPGAKMVYAIRGQAPFKKLVDEMRAGKSFLDVINIFKISGGAIRETNVTSGNPPVDFAINELNFTQSKTYQAPLINTNESLLVLAASEYKGRMLPTDVKAVNSKSQVALNIAAGSVPTVLSVLKKKDNDSLNGALSVSMVPFDGSETTLIPLMNSPQAISLYEVKIPAVAAPTRVRPVATYSALLKVERKTSGDYVFEVTTKTWEVYANEWLTGFSLPKWPSDTKRSGINRWEVSLVGRQDDIKIELGPELLENATHATRSSVDF